LLTRTTRYTSDTIMATVINKAQLWYIKTQSTVEAQYGPVDISVMHAGGIRADLGTVSEGRPVDLDSRG
jgi:2',3'-cyclic-nucleotide 2'-phosphodiesterase (5'-nucleotidase family)